jgi:heptosyltransferase-2
LYVLREKSKKRIILIGKGKPLFRIPSKIVDLTQKTDLIETAALIANADGLVCNDTGIMHMADASNTRTITIWGPTVRSFGFAPIQPNLEIMEISGLKCRPCSLHGTERCPEGHFKCMRLISVIDVVRKLEEKKIL